MILHWSPKSPFVRKVMIAAHELDLLDQITLIRSVAAMSAPNPQIMADNPLSKIPTLVLDDGAAIYDSSVICAFLNDLADGPLLPRKGRERWTALTREALADGLLDVLILWRNEREKLEAAQSPAWLKAFALKIERGLERLESDADALSQTPFNVGHVAVGCLLSYLDFRFETLNWRANCPGLSIWHSTFSARPSVVATEIKND
jgi:glutathione S-transferase